MIDREFIRIVVIGALAVAMIGASLFFAWTVSH